MEKTKLNLQLFADGDPEPAPIEEPTPEPNTPPAEPEAKYTDADVDKLISQKFAEWQKKQERKTSEAERLGRMTAEEKANERMKALEDRIHEYELRESKAEMTAQARSMLNDKGIHVDDALLANLISDDADATKASVESFVSLFQTAVEKAVKDKVKSDAPRAGASSGMTKEQILAVTNRAERQQLIKDNMNLFQ